MLKIRLQRVGKRGQAYFRLVISEHARTPQAKFLELLGSYDPHAKKLIVKEERIAYWMAHGAQQSASVNNLLINHKLSDRPKMPSWKPKKKDASSAPAPAAAPAA